MNKHQYYSSKLLLPWCPVEEATQRTCPCMHVEVRSFPGAAPAKIQSPFSP